MKKIMALSGALAAGALVLAGTAGASAPQPAASGGPVLAYSVNKGEPSAQADCQIRVSQPGGSGTRVHITYYNYCNTNLRVTPAAYNGKGNRYTYVANCRQVPHGSSITWTIEPNQFPPEPVNLNEVTFCW